MYYVKTEHSFDSAHFLAGYEGKCRNIHGHEWRVVIEICRPDLDEEGQTRDMMFDFGQLKKDVKREVDAMDHALIIEKGSLMRLWQHCRRRISGLLRFHTDRQQKDWLIIFMRD